MKRRLISLFLAVVSLGPSVFAQAGSEEYLKAVEFYDRGMFERAQTIFGEIASRTSDVMARGYEVLCGVRLQEVGNRTMADQFISDCPYCNLVSQIRFYNALNLFDERDYGASVAEFGRIDERNLLASQFPEFLFKQAYSRFELDEYDKAADLFAKVEKLPYSDYTAPSRYSLGYINYSWKKFDEAYEWFDKSSKDTRFTDQALSYMVECRYMKKDYSYVIDNGQDLLERASDERAPHLAKLISESYLATGEAAKAREYYDKIEKSSLDMDNDDYFYAGTVLYSTGDYKGAIENFSRMKNLTDSIGQIASYQLGYSYIKTGNKVAAMDAFRTASSFNYNPDVREDAHFNYAKLSFDLNHNPTVFNDYMESYPEKKKDDSIYSYMALASLYGRDYAGAVEAYSNIDMLDDDQKSNYMKANYLRAVQLIGGGSWRDAVPMLKAAGYYSDKRDPFNQLSKYWLAESYYRSEQYDKAAETFTSLYNMSALDDKTEGRLIPYDLAYTYFRQGDYTNAAKWFDQYLSGKNLTAGEDAASRRADCDFIRKDYAKAVKEYESAIARFPYKSNLYPYLQAGIAYGLTGDKNGKINILSKVKDAKPSAEFYSEAMYELGRAYVAAEDNESAISIFKKLGATTRDKTISARSLIELGMISRNMSQYEQALDYYKQVIGEMPDTEYASDALLAIESIYQSEGRGDEYLDYAESVGANKDKSEAEKDQMYFNAAEQVFMTENYTKALASLQSYLDRYPQGSNVAQADYYLAECHRNLGNKEQACDWYRKSLEQDPVSQCSESALLNVSRLSYELEHYKDAYETWSQLLSSARIASNKQAALVGMMRCAFKGQDYTGAISCASDVKGDVSASDAEKREADYITAKSNLFMGYRDEALRIFNSLASQTSTPEGAEAAYMVIQDAYDQGKYDTVQSKVYKFAEKGGDQPYWLAKAFIVLGDSFADQENFTQAKATFESIRNGYVSTGSSDDVLDNVNMRLEKLKTLM